MFANLYCVFDEGKYPSYILKVYVDEDEYVDLAFCSCRVNWFAYCILEDAQTKSSAKRIKTQTTLLIIFVSISERYYIFTKLEQNKY